MVDMKPTQQYVILKNGKITGFSVIDSQIDDSNPEHVILPLYSHPLLENLDINEYEVNRGDRDYQILEIIKNSAQPSLIIKESI